ncbi:MAG: alpha-1,2-fucosyltransferase [Planctomycetota bacterium]
MIVTRLKGGLGNQMFQYAVGRHLAHIHGTALKFDLTKYADDPQRTYDLHVFNIAAAEAASEDIRSLCTRGARWPARLMARLAGRRLTYFRETSKQFDPAILQLPDDVYLEGYWQSELYFRAIADIIRAEFTVKAPLSGRNAEVAAMIRAAAAPVSLHVRRGDYLTNPNWATVPEAFYRAAAARIAAQMANPHFFCFSDDPAWVRDHLDLGQDRTVIEGNAGAAHEDLRLMSLCRHHIIANSSFSWWGAWLDPGPDKIVIGPRRWFKDPDKAMGDMIPEGWILL